MSKISSENRRSVSLVQVTRFKFLLHIGYYWLLTGIPFLVIEKLIVPWEDFGVTLAAIDGLGD